MKKIARLLDVIESENEAFERMTTAQKRVVIAQDCITRITVEHILPNHFGFIRESDAKKLMFSEHCSLKDAFNTMNSCSACAKGALFLSYVGRANKMQTINLSISNVRYDASHTKLLEIFDIRQLAMIEFAYEDDQYLHYDGNGNNLIFTDEEKEKIRIFFLKFTNSTSRMLAICENIIENEGTFIL